jgi:hypothetical protein
MIGDRNHFEKGGSTSAAEDFWMPRANTARGKVLGARPRTPARGTPPETPAPFPFTPIFQNGPRRPGYAEEIFSKTENISSVPKTSFEKGKGATAKAKPSPFAVASGLPLVAPELLNRFAVGKHHRSILGTFLTS